MEDQMVARKTLITATVYRDAHGYFVLVRFPEEPRTKMKVPHRPIFTVEAETLVGIREELRKEAGRRGITLPNYFIG